MEVCLWFFHVRQETKPDPQFYQVTIFHVQFPTNSPRRWKNVVTYMVQVQYNHFTWSHLQKVFYRPINERFQYKDFTKKQAVVMWSLSLFVVLLFPWLHPTLQSHVTINRQFLSPTFRILDWCFIQCVVFEFVYQILVVFFWFPAWLYIHTIFHFQIFHFRKYFFFDLSCLRIYKINILIYISFSWFFN